VLGENCSQLSLLSVCCAAVWVAAVVSPSALGSRCAENPQAAFKFLFKTRVHGKKNGLYTTLFTQTLATEPQLLNWVTVSTHV